MLDAEIAASKFVPGRSLQDIDGQDWGDPDPRDSHLAQTCTWLHRKPISDFDDEDLRVMVGQGIGLPTLVPLATSAVERRPLASGDLYPGALLAALIRLPGDYWAQHIELHARVVAVARAIDLGDPELAGTDLAVTLRCWLEESA